MKALVTGASGFVGSHLTDELIRAGWKVKCVVRPTSSLRWLTGLPVEIVVQDLVRPHGLRETLRDVDVVFHVAGVTKGEDRRAFFDGNLHATCRLVDACTQSGNRRLMFIYVSSLSAAGPSLNGRPRREEDSPAPVSWYGQSKLLAEKAVLDGFPLEAVRVIRPPIVYGPRDLDFLQVFRTVSLGFHLLTGQGHQRFNFIHVDDLVQAILLATRWKGRGPPIFFVSGNGDYDWLSVGKTVGRTLGCKPLMLPIPLPVLLGLGGVGSFLTKATGKALVLNIDKIREAGQPNWLCSSTRAREQLGFHPSLCLEEGLASTAEWYRQIGWLPHYLSRPFR